MKYMLSILSIILGPFYAIVLFQMAVGIRLGAGFNQVFLISLGISTVVFFLVVSSANFFAVLEHEFTHMAWCLLFFKRPRSLRVDSDGSGQIEYASGGNCLISLAPYFSLTLTFLALPFYELLRPEYYGWYFGLLGALTGFHTSTTIKETRLFQTDIQRHGVVCSLLIIAFGNIVSYGLLLAFVTGRWRGMGRFLKAGPDKFLDFVHNLRLILERLAN